MSQNIFDEIEAESKKQSKFVKIHPGEKLTVQFVTKPNPKERIRIVDKEYTRIHSSDKTTGSKRVQYTVIDPKQPNQEKILELALRFTGQLNALLRKGMKLIDVERRGAGTSTNYVFVPL